MSTLKLQVFEPFPRLLEDPLQDLSILALLQVYPIGSAV
jgi:hypothetical protein